jgi:Flp pilus assembly protein TadG
MAGGARRARRRSGHQGQALLEFAMIFTFIMLLLAGVTDVGGLLDVHVAGIYAARQGARTGAVIGPVTAADCAIVGAVHSVLANQPNLTVTQITIYQAGPNGLSDGTASYYVGTADCQNGTIIDDSTGSPTSPLPGSTPWDPTTRNVTAYTEDSLGVKIDYTYQFQFNLLGAGAFPTSDYAVYPMNPGG